MTASNATKSLVETLPLLARNGGDWYGTYLHLDEAGHVLDRHASHLNPVTTEGSNSYAQTNRYTWADGREVSYTFTGTLKGDRVVYDTERIYGEAWEADADTLILKFRYKDEPRKYIYEYIHLSADDRHRTRVWHWFDERGEVYKRTLIKETRAVPSAE